MSSGLQFAGLPLNHTVHPDIKKYHKSYSTSPKDMRDIRTAGKQACAVCGALAQDLRRCGKCKHASYCSKECQKADWPTHKTACSAADSGVNMMRVAQTLDASTFLTMQLQGAFVAAFDLLRDPHLDRLFAARVDIGVEPADLMAFMDIYHGGTGKPTTEGMVQINAFTPLPDAWITAQAMQVWRTARESTKAAGMGTSPVGLVVLSKANALVQIFPIIVFPQMIRMMRDSPTFQRVSSLTGITTVVPVNIYSLMEMMNKHIRADSKNKLALRTEMTPADVQVIRDTANGNVLKTRGADWPLVAPPPQLAATILKEKIARDPIYSITFTFK